MFLYGLKQCDTCRKVLKIFPKVTFVDVRKEGVPEDVLRRAYVEFGDALLNRKSTTWRNLTTIQRQEDAFFLLQEHPTLMKRPLIDSDGVLYLGWTPEVQAALLG